MIWEFMEPESSCHIYIVKADSKELAIDKFIEWQNENLENKWPEEIIRDETNWMVSTSVIAVE